jgi:putative heme-binding domain-containing protein
LNPYFRKDALQVLAWFDADDNSHIFTDILLHEKDPTLRKSAIGALSLTTTDDIGEFLVNEWPNLTPEERGLAVSVYNVSPQRQIQFLHAVQSNQIQASVLGWGRTVRFLNSKDPKVRNLAREVLEGNETISDSVWQQYQKVLTLEGSTGPGEQVFKRSCASCHQISGQVGVNYGPDLAAVSNRAKSGIMIDILKPNRSISDGFELWTVEDNDGQSHTGIIVNENVNTLALRIASGEEVMIQQAAIVNRTAAELSAMPEGLHHQISHQEMADLLEYLKNSGRAGLP